MAGRLGKPHAVTATAHKLARLGYTMVKNGSEYTDAGQDYYERQYKERAVRSLERRAKALGFALVSSPVATAVT
jgi:hypothetical protein